MNNNEPIIIGENLPLEHQFILKLLLDLDHIRKEYDILRNSNKVLTERLKESELEREKSHI
jgi:hypothetical protein